MASPTETALRSEPIGEAQGVTESSRIDAAVASPVLFLTGLSILWLLVSSALQLVVSWKHHSPSFLGNCEWFTYGRVEAAQSTAFLYGWASTAGLALSAWLNARLARSQVGGAKIVGVAGLFWSVGVALAVIGVLSGDATGLPAFEIPIYSAPILFVAFAVIGGWIVQSVKVGKSSTLYASQWYLIAAIFSFGWLFSVAQVTLLFAPVRGTLQAVVQSWFAGGIYLLWLLPVGLAALYYLLPKIGGRSVNAYYLSSHGFWWLFAVGGFVGVGILAGGPVPAWVQGLGVAGGLMLLVPAFAILYTLISSLPGAMIGLKSHIAGKFVFVSIVSLVITFLWVALSALPPISVLTKFTLATKALAGVGTYGFVSMAFFAAIYYFVPKLGGAEWSSHGLVDVHFWSSFLGLLLTTASLVTVGLQQSAALADSKAALLPVLVSNSSLLFAASCGVILTTIGHISFSMGFIGVLIKAFSGCKSGSNESTVEAAAR